MTTTAPAVPDLSDLPPEPVAQASYDEWSLPSMGGYLASMDSRNAWYAASMAAQRQQQGAPHLDVVLALATAEERAPASERPFHAARLDAYVAAYGLRGWYRYVDSKGVPRVQVNFLRTPDMGDRGRYYVSTATLCWSRVVDRDTGKFAGGDFTSRKAAEAWITEAEGGQS